MQGQSEHTHEKQWRRLQPIMRIALQAMKYRAGHLVIADLNAGTGYNERVDALGSPIIALQELARLGTVPATLATFESAVGRRHELQGRLCTERRRLAVDHVSHHTFTDNADPTQADALLTLVPRRDLYGLIYSDPDGATLPIENIRRLAQAPGWGRVDVLLHLNATALKRAREAYPDRPYWAGAHLDAWVERVGKQHWWITEPDTRWQWTFLFGSNWAGFPGLAAYGFQGLTSDTGQGWMKRANEILHAR